jgi:hypothetical protein
MKTLQLKTTDIVSSSRILMVVAGIVTAVVCSLVLLKDVNALLHVPF